jgi:hypothetical protein
VSQDCLLQAETSHSPRIRVHDLRLAESGRWEFRDSSLTWAPPNRYTLSSKFDPFPCYAHDRAVAERAAAHVADRCPPLWDVDLWLADREEVGRSNGHSNIDDGHYEGGKWVKDRRGFIILSGKRVPPHPAMTRYLVGHEYGHSVAYMLNALRLDDKERGHVSSTGDLEREYAKARGLPESSLHHGGGGTWHDSCAEVLACDFRVLVCDIEPECWPHPGVQRPEGILAIRAWWLTALVQLEEARGAAGREKPGERQAG